MKKLLLLVGITFLTGCNDSVITKLKNTPIPEFPQYTYGQILDHRKLCESMDWEKNTAHNGIIEITYTCTLNKPTATSLRFDADLGNRAYKEDYNKKLLELQNQRDSVTQPIKKQIEMLEKNIKYNIQSFEDMIKKNENIFDIAFNFDAIKIDDVTQLAIVSWQNFKSPISTQLYTELDKSGIPKTMGYDLSMIQKIRKYIAAIEQDPESLSKRVKSPNKPTSDNRYSNRDDSFFYAEYYKIQNCALSNHQTQADAKSEEEKIAQNKDICIANYVAQLKSIANKINAIEPELRKVFHANLTNSIKILEKGLVDLKNDLKRHEESATDSRLEAEAKTYAQERKIRYNAKNTRLRQEKITWIYNEYSNIPYLKNHKFVWIDGNDLEYSMPLNFKAIVYSSTHDELTDLNNYIRTQYE